MQKEIIQIHAAIQEFRMLDCWYMVEILTKQLEELKNEGL
jgi:hypothetical protein